MYIKTVKSVCMAELPRFISKAKSMLQGHVYISIDQSTGMYKVNYVKLRQIKKSYKKAS